MKNKLIYICLVLAFFNGYAQSDATKEFLNSIKLPSSPALSILDAQANTITRPKSWSSLETSLLINNSNNNSGLTIPKDLAIEFSPYWAQKNLKMSNEDYLIPSAKESLVRNFSFSIATTENLIIKNATEKTNAIGLGIRTMIWEGSKGEKEKMLQLLKDAELMNKLSLNLFFFYDYVDCSNGCQKNQFITDYINLLNQNRKDVFADIIEDSKIQSFLTNFKSFLKNKISEGTMINADFGNVIEPIIDEYLELDELILSLEEIQENRKGFKLEVAAAMAIDFPKNSTDFSIIPRYSFWITPSYQPYKNDWIEFLGVLRYQGFNLDYYFNLMDDSDFMNLDYALDYGAQVVLRFNKIKFSFEVTGRSGRNIIDSMNGENGTVTKTFKDESDFKYVANLSYNISNNLVITYNFGKNFDPFIDINGNLISLLSLNFGFDTPTTNNLSTKK